jgi:hypothetical protein
MTDFHYNSRNAKIQGLSVQVGELFADMYRDTKQSNEAMECLEAYKSLRRLLPREGLYSGARVARHEGAEAAHKATQNES